MATRPSPGTDLSKTGKVSKATMMSFLGSAALLVSALGVFGYLMWPRQESVPRKSTAPGSVDRSRLMDSPSIEASGSLEDSAPEGPKTASTPDDAKEGGETLNQDKTSVPLSLGDEPLNSQDEGDIHKALELLDQGNTAEASMLLEGVLKRDPTNERALVEMAMMQLLDLRAPDQAVKYLQRAYEVNPTNPMVMNELVSLFEEQGKVEEGIQFFADLAQKKAQNQDVSRDVAYGAGQMLMIAGKDQEALGYLQKAVEGGRGPTRAFVDLAETYSRLGDHEKSIDSYLKSISFQEREIAEQEAKGIPMQYGAERIGYTKMQLVREYLKAGQKDQAQTLMEEVKKLLPGDDSVATLQKQVLDSMGGAAKG